MNVIELYIPYITPFCQYLVVSYYAILKANVGIKQCPKLKALNKRHVMI